MDVRHGLHQLADNANDDYVLQHHAGLLQLLCVSRKVATGAKIHCQVDLLMALIEVVEPDDVRMVQKPQPSNFTVQLVGGSPDVPPVNLLDGPLHASLLVHGKVNRPKCARAEHLPRMAEGVVLVKCLVPALRLGFDGYDLAPSLAHRVHHLPEGDHKTVEVHLRPRGVSSGRPVPLRLLVPALAAAVVDAPRRAGVALLPARGQRNLLALHLFRGSFPQLVGGAAHAQQDVELGAGGLHPSLLKHHLAGVAGPRVNPEGRARLHVGSPLAEHLEDPLQLPASRLGARPQQLLGLLS
mmetsp:Transcript_4037/g.9251  ORF Transcript_4037/g.9251 Transcript_4037/m.9251 type:complete len:297 (+) Transcript_4037:1231-2121(+)